MMTMNPILVFAFGTACVILSIRFGRYISAERIHRRRANELGCGEPVQNPYRWAFGIVQIVNALRATRKHVFPDFLLERSKAAITAQMSFLGQRRIFTCDPAIIKAVLATQFKEFGLGDDRINNFAPLLGHGIVSLHSIQKSWVLQDFVEESPGLTFCLVFI